MHPTADTLLVIFSNGPARRVMPGVRLLLRSRKVMMKLISLLLCLVAVSALASGKSRPSRVPPTPAGINQLVENRGGHVSCWGVVIRLGNSRFNDVINPEQIVIREAKHGHDLRDIMSWRVEKNGKRLVIKFKPGMGDFGGGNSVEVQVDRSAFAGDVECASNRFEWSINTDVL
jgi:hypothetical protein